MASTGTPKFKNDAGVRRIEVGVKELECVGAAPPYDHPHIFLDMGAEEEILCPYCSTLYSFSNALSAEESNPAGALLLAE